MKETLYHWLTHPYVVSLLSLFIGFYILRDVVRAIFSVVDGALRTRRTGSED